MSRIGRQPITVPTGVDVTLNGDTVEVRGPKGQLSRTIPEPVTVRRDENGTLVVDRPNDERRSRALHGLTRTLVQNMVTGVTTGFEKELEIVGVGYRATAKGDRQIELALGFSHPVFVEAPEGISFEVSTPTRVMIRGIDKEKVGQIAADIRKIRKPEPYKGKGVRYVGEVVRRKAGKAGK
ncbi:MAG TPA: 50S ribosomal protein L6 [Acidimicrobiales bacterium]|nr:50S ribosomal protein L6 [Acidimicrobiales bacterium]